MPNKKSPPLLGLFLILISLSTNNPLQAQLPIQQAEEMVNFSKVLWYYYPFYLLSFVIWCLFLYHLLKPALKLQKFIYGLGLLSLLGAFLLQNQLQAHNPQAERPEDPGRFALQDPQAEQVQVQERYRDNIEGLTSLWLIALPNLVVMGVCLGRDLLSTNGTRKQEPSI